MMTKNILICGVGGQGSLLASRILGQVAISQGWDTKVSEVHGMSQRGGSVVTYVKYSDTGKVASPVICRGEADVIISFEQLETARWLPFLKKDGKIVTSTQKIYPMPVISGNAVYPESLIEKIRENGNVVVECNAVDIAKALGNVKVANVVLIGLYAKHSGFDKEIFLEAVRECVPEKFLELNLKAFEAGYNA
ncbi:MAG: indolepyruvate oxidoreductase subunit beta [Eubacteriales bacterium]|nr:indolepyruvate oxidoreductase subunit beta [Eubacteriales bacterium]MDD4474516.1 indolepyruvate oxidoreductase subunit beta [Eubacteriales bacterium]